MLYSSVLAWVRLNRVFQKIDRAQTVHLRNWGLNVAQFDVLAQVGAQSSSITQQELADRLLVTKGNISLLLNRMEEIGLLKRYQEGRNKYIRLTVTGQKLHDEVVPAHEAFIASLLTDLSPQEVNTLQRLLRKIDHSLR